ncbi:hypothetical protein D9M69_685870 [compost metagenome]
MKDHGQRGFLHPLHEAGGVDGGTDFGDPGPPGLLGRGRDRRLPFAEGLGSPFAFPSDDRPVGLPWNHRVDTQLRGSLDRQFIAVALGQGLDEHQADGRAVLRHDG